MNNLLLYENDKNTWRWDLEKDGNYSINSLRRFFDRYYLEEGGVETIWRKEVPRKINIFIWRLRLKHLPTIDNLNYRGIVTPDTLCPAYKSYPDSAKHIFLECSTAKEVMARLACRWNKLPDLSNYT